MEKERQDALHFYHIGRVIKFLSPKDGRNLDRKSKVVVEMWDNNIITCEAGSTPLKDDDYVIVRFNGLVQPNNNIFMSADQITDVLSKSAGDDVWSSYKNFLDKVKPTHPLTG